MKTEAKKKIRVLCVDDNAETRAVFALLLKGHPEFDVLDPLRDTAKLATPREAVSPALETGGADAADGLVPIQLRFRVSFEESPAEARPALRRRGILRRLRASG